MGDEGVFAGSGGFRVDRDRALELIRRYQLPDAGLFAALFLRAAAASGADDIRVCGGQRSFELRCTGRPFLREELEGLYDALFVDAGPERERRRDLALGVLTALHAGPKEVVVVSGEGDRRFRLTVPRLGHERVEPVRESVSTTEVRLAWGWGDPVPDWRASLRRPWAAALTPSPVLLDEAYLARLPAPADGIAFARGSARGWLRARMGAEERTSRLWVYRHGVLVSEASCVLPIEVLGCVDDPRLPLGMSLTAVAQSPRWERLKRWLGRCARELLRRKLQEHARAFPEAARLLGASEFLELWGERPAWSASLELPDGPELVRRALVGGARAGVLADRAEGLRLLTTAWTADWLHQAAAALRAAGEPGDPELRLLLEAPMLLAARGGTLTLGRAQALLEREGAVPYSRVERADADPGVVWCPSALELGWLKLHFGEAIREG